MAIQCSHDDRTYEIGRIDELIQFLRQFDANQTVALVCDEPHELATLFTQLQNLTPSLVCSLQWFFKKNTTIKPAYMWQRQQFIIENQQRIEEILRSDAVDDSVKSTAGKIPNWITRHGNANSMLQQQLQHRQQHQQQQEKITRTSDTNHSAVVKERVTEVFFTRIDTAISDVITRDNIEKSLRVFYDSLPLKSDRPSLTEIWDNLVGGVGAQYIQDKSKTITAVTPDVMKLIISHYDSFFYGVNVNNLPLLVNEFGRAIQRIELCGHAGSQQYVLRFTSEPAALANIDKFTPLLRSEFSPKQHAWLRAEFKRPEEMDWLALLPAESDESTKISLQNTFTNLNDAPDVAQAHQACLNLLSLVVANDQTNTAEKNKIALLTSALTTFQQSFGASLTANHYRYLADMCVHGGIESVLIFLKTVTQSADKLAFLPFFDEPINWQTWATKLGLTKLLAAIELQGVDAVWWQALIAQHKDARAPMHFNVLLDAFDDFAAKIRVDKSNQLSAQFPFKGIRHIQSGLQRLLYIIQNSAEKDQIKRLMNLGLGALQAYFASYFEGMTSVSAEMMLEPDNALLQLHDGQSPQKTSFAYTFADQSIFKASMDLGTLHAKFISTKQMSRSIHYADTVSFYYRYIARPLVGNIKNRDTYVQIEKNIDDLSLNLTPQDKGAGLFFVLGDENTTPSLPTTHLSGYVCVRDGSGNPIALYFFDRHDASSPQRFSMDISLKGILSRLRSDRDRLSPGELTEISEYTQFTPVKGNQHRPLSDAAKASLLYICAVVGSGVRARNQSILPADELNAFLQVLKESADKVSMDYEQLIAYIHHEVELDEDKTPTLGELTTLIKRIPIDAAIENKATYLKSTLKSTLSFVTHVGDAAFRTLDDYQTRLEHCIKENDANGCLPYHVFIDQFNKLYQCTTLDKDEREFLQQWTPALALLDDFAELDVNRLKLFIKKMQHLEPKLKQHLLALLYDVNLQITKILPKFEVIDQLVSSLQHIDFVDEEDKDVATGVMTKNKLKTLIQDKTTYCIGRGPMQKMTINLIEVFKKFTNQPEYDKVKEKIDPYQSMFNAAGLGGEVLANLEALQRFKALLSANKATEDEVLASLTAIDKSLAALMAKAKKKASWLVAMIQHAVKLLTPEAAEQIDKFFTEPGLGVFAPVFFDDYCTPTFREQLKNLQIESSTCRAFVNFNPNEISLLSSFLKDQEFEKVREKLKDYQNALLTTDEVNKVKKALQSAKEKKSVCEDLQKKLVDTFESYILAQIRPANLDGTTVEIAQRYGESCQRVAGFLNSLIRLRNTNPETFRLCLDKIRHNQLYQTFRFQDVARLFDVLSQFDERISIQQQLTLILSDLQNTQLPGDPEKLCQVLDGLQALSEDQAHLDDEALLTYFKDSVTHNFRSTQPFNFKGEINIKKMCDKLALAPQQAKLLRQSVSRVFSILKKTDVDIANQFLEHTEEKLMDKMPAALSFMLLLLDGIRTADDTAIYNTLLQNIPSDKLVLNQWQRIFSASSTMRALTLLEMEQVIKKLQKMDEAALLEMCDILFACEPYPEKSAFIKALTDDNPTVLSDFQTEFDCHPYGLENWEKVRHNFNTDRVTDVIGGIRHLLNNQPLSEAEQIDLKRQFDYVNAIGKPDSPYTLNPVNRKGQSYPLKTIDGKTLAEITLRTCSRKTLKQLAEHLIKEFRLAEQENSSPDCLSARSHRQLTLQLLAVMRESYYRSTKRVPNSTQMLSLIYSLDYPERQLFGIRTGEGKSITTGLFSALLCAKGGTVFVPTANRTLVRQDYIEKHNRRFFLRMNFSSSQIDNNSGKEAYHVGGIHYGADGDLSNFFSKASLKGWNLFNKQGRRYPLFMVKDEYDYSMDDRTQFRFAISKDPLHQDKSPYEWVYEAANAFVKEKRLSFSKAKEHLTEEECALQFKRFLEVTAEASQANIEEKKNHILQWLPHLSDLLECAADAVDYVEGTDFFITSQDEEGRPLGCSIAVPFNANGVPQWGGTFADSRHPCLHVLLKAKYPGRLFPFPIDPEQICIASKSSMGFMRLFRVVIGLTGTPGSGEELLEQQDKNGLFATEFPPHKPGNRKELPPLFVKEEALDDAILDAILLHTWYHYPLPIFVIRVLDRILSYYRASLQYLYASLGYAPIPEQPKQPIIIVVKNKNKAEALYDKLQKKLGKDRLQTITGEETHAERTELLEKAAQDGMITIGTPLVGRGTDFEPTHVQGLVVFQTFMDTLRNTLQIMGRTARKGKDGTSGAIYADTDMRFSDWLSMLFGPSLAQRKEMISQRQSQLNKEVAVQRYYLQEVDEIQQIILDQFDAWMSVFLGETGERRAAMKPEDPLSEASLLRQRGKLIQLLNTGWQKRLQAVTPDGLSNPYVYWVEGVLNTDHLNKALKDKDNQGFEQEALRIWQTFANDLQTKAEAVNLAKYSYEDKVRLERLKTDDMQEALQYRKLNLQRKRLNTTISIEKKQKDQKRMLDLASNEAFAVHFYDSQQLSPVDQISILKTHAEIYLKQVFTQLPPALTYLNQDEPHIFKRYIQLINQLEAKDACRKDAACQQTAFECIAFYQMIANESHLLFSKEENFAINARIDSMGRAYATQLLENLEADLQFGWSQDILFRSVESAQIRKAIDTIQQTMTRPITLQYPRHQKIADLHQILIQYQQQLHSMRFYFPWASYLFGYPDPKKVIKNALKQINILAKFEPYPEHKQAINREIGQCRAYFADFLQEIETLSPDSSNHEGWIYLKEELKSMYANANDGFAVVDILMSRLSSIPEEANIKMKLNLQNRMRGFFVPTSTSVTEHLKDQLKMIRKKFRQDHPGYNDPLCGELFLSRRETQLKDSLNRIIYNTTGNQAIYQSMHLEVKAGHTGFEPYYEVVIHSNQCDLISVDKFIRDPRRERIENALALEKNALEKVNRSLAEACLKRAMRQRQAKNKETKEQTVPIEKKTSAKDTWNQVFSSLPWTSKQRVNTDSYPVKEERKGLFSSLFKRKASPLALVNQKISAETKSDDRKTMTPDDILTKEIMHLKTTQKECQASVTVLEERLAKCSPNLMLRRFETLCELLQFEAELKASAQALPALPLEILKESTESVTASVASSSLNHDDFELESIDFNFG